MNSRLPSVRFGQLLTTVCVATACSDGPRNGASYISRDSAGIQIHEYDQSALTGATQWMLSEAPSIDIGSGLEDDPRYEFFRIESLQRFSTGEFVVLNAGTREIRVYDSTGKYVRDIGRVGTGPGEFAGPRWFQVMGGDSLLVYDNNEQRLTVFGPDGELARTVPIGSLKIGYELAVGLLDDKSFLVSKATGEFRPPSPGGELRRDSLTYRRFTTDGKELSPFGTYPGREIFWLPEGSRRVFLEPLGFGRSFELVSGDSLIYLGASDSYEIRAYTHAGELRQILRVNLDPVPVTNSMIAAYQEPDPAVYVDSAMLASVRRVREAMSYPATTPAFNRLAVDSNENLWVNQYPAYPDRNTVWHIFSAAGRLLGRIELPAGFQPKLFESTAITGVWTDDEHVEHLRRYEIVRPNGE